MCHSCYSVSYLRSFLQLALFFTNVNSIVNKWYYDNFYFYLQKWNLRYIHLISTNLEDCTLRRIQGKYLGINYVFSFLTTPENRSLRGSENWGVS